MAKIRVEVVHEFKGETVLLVVMDRAGIKKLQDVIAEEKCDTIHEIVINKNEVKVEILKDKIKWFLTKDKQDEFLEKMTMMSNSPLPCHNYIDISSPAPVLYISLDEYL